MGPGYFVIAIMGCADGEANCTPVATIPTQYESQAACAAAAPASLASSTSFDFPSLVAECRSIAKPAAAGEDEQPGLPVLALRG